MLITSVASQPAVGARQRALTAIFAARKLSAVRYVDGADPACRDRRTALFAASGTREYPQVFTRLAGETRFIGGHDDVETLHESGAFTTTFAPFL